MQGDEPVTLAVRHAGRVLTVAGLAAWVFQHAGDEASASRCGVLQDLVDRALQTGERVAVQVPRSVVVEAAGLWRDAAALTDGEPADRLRLRAARLEELLR